MGCSGSKQQPSSPSPLPTNPPLPVVAAYVVEQDASESTSPVAEKPAVVDNAVDSKSASLDPLVLVSDPAGTVASVFGGVVGGTAGLFTGIVNASTTLDPSAIYIGIAEGGASGAAQANAGAKSALDLVGLSVANAVTSVTPASEPVQVWNEWVDGKPDGLNELSNNSSSWLHSGFSAVEPDGWTVYKVTQKRIMRPQADFPSYSTIAAGVKANEKWVDPNPPIWTQNHIDKNLPLDWWFPNQLWGPEVPNGLFIGQKSSSGITVSDCNQGDVGDCWFISAIAMTSMYPELFKQVFSKIDAEKGIYEFKFYNEKTDEFVTVCVDERLPVLTPIKAIVYCQSKTIGELWPTLLEKAYAKLFGSYTAIEAGSIALGICNMLCKPPSMYLKVKDDAVFLRDPVKLWAKLKSLHESGHLLGNSFIDHVNGFNDRTHKLDVDPNSKKWQVRNHDTDSIISGHAYGIMALYDVEPGIQLIKIRNPWGRQGCWQGDWSKTCSRWTERPDIAKLVDFQSVNDGIFFMSISDLSQQIASITACRVFEKGTPVVWNGLNYSDPAYKHEAPYKYVDNVADASALAKARAPVA